MFEVVVLVHGGRLLPMSFYALMLQLMAESVVHILCITQVKLNLSGYKDCLCTIGGLHFRSLRSVDNLLLKNTGCMVVPSLTPTLPRGYFTKLADFLSLNGITNRAVVLFSCG